MAWKKDLTPLSKGGSVVKHKGKGSQMAGMPDRKQISNLGTAPGASMNNYAKATPMARPTPDSAPGIGSGDWSGNGM